VFAQSAALQRTLLPVLRGSDAAQRDVSAPYMRTAAGGPVRVTEGLHDRRSCCRHAQVELGEVAFDKPA